MIKRLVSSLFLTTCLWSIANLSEYSLRFQPTHSNIKKYEVVGISSILRLEAEKVVLDQRI